MTPLWIGVIVAFAAAYWAGSQLGPEGLTRTSRARTAAGLLGALAFAPIAWALALAIRLLMHPEIPFREIVGAAQLAMAAVVGSPAVLAWGLAGFLAARHQAKGQPAAFWGALAALGAIVLTIVGAVILLAAPLPRS